MKSIKRDKKRIIDFLVELCQKLNQDTQYLVRLEPGVQAPEETLEKQSGSCRDSAWLLVNILRHFGLAARFVSGYLIQLKADIKSLDGPSGTDKDFTDLHAWAEVYLPGAGWLGLDATSGLLTGEGHIPLVATSEPMSAAPISGCIEDSKAELIHQMSVTRFYEDPRVTKPYTDKQWHEIQLIGQKVDADLIKNDVKLTMGGEPTFVSIDDMDGLEWNTGALGKNKRLLAQILFNRLKARRKEGTLTYSGQGKWYPGEPLPRWLLGCYWRKDGIPIWKDAKLLADETVDYKYTNAHSKQFIETLTGKLGVDANNILPGYEDVLYYLWREKKLPNNVDPLKSKLKDVLERDRLTNIFEKDLGEVMGYCLPLSAQTQKQSTRWSSTPWRFRTEHMYLIPGESPMGLRMPLDSLPWAREEDKLKPHAHDPFSPMEVLGDDLDLETPISSKLKTQSKKEQKITNESGKDIVRTALCVQAREGRIYVFLPPVEKIEAYLDLVKHIEMTASELGVTVVIEGYAPPFDLRVDCFKITPDPGVIELNVAPVNTWDQLVEQTNVIYEEAYLSRLGTEKFMLDGRHSGTGGGNHVVLGGAIPSESPFLRRPDLLASVISYWHNHPSLSYLFSCLFIGPTSQAPRADEGRRDSVYELEIAMQQVNQQIKNHGQCPPWVVDRLFRHLLVDGTGNTHRAELCIDKLFSPDSSTGRLGLVEFRGFEMPPHAQMSITQQLLIRAFVAKFWNTPFKETLTRWDTILHDRFLLPHFVKQDFEGVLSDLKKCGFDMKMDFFAPHFEFRFPIVGEVVHEGIKLELRTAIEPWYVLGEEPAGGSTARFVDSSIERLQIKAIGMTDKRYIVTCNGRKIPLHKTGTKGEFIAAIRYRAWQPPSCLHPTIPIHTPLTFDIIDTWNHRSIGGCMYHVVHPGGRNYDTFPVNALEAESRRSARFFKIGHTHGEINPLPNDEYNPDYPHTLDLRRSI